ncbi:unnamed protein product [Danaus chrysippus]|uniref:(African queen) hypothetical protein n=1 Tax=Danaus chrysippus TaxID=151541 RepID=A0A8J2RID1_9NEOP|nr:unnamed protein product [Danaus chrysippus]
MNFGQTNESYFYWNETNVSVSQRVARPRQSEKVVKIGAALPVSIYKRVIPWARYATYERWGVKRRCGVRRRRPWDPLPPPLITPDGSLAPRTSQDCCEPFHDNFISSEFEEKLGFE